MRKVDVAGDGVDGHLVGVIDDVDDIVEARAAGGVEHVVVDGVAVHDAGAAVGIVDELAVVVVDDGLAGGDAGQDALAAAGEAGEEVRLDEALGHEQVGLGGQLVDDEVAAAGQLADVGEVLDVVAVMDDYFLVRDYLLAELADELLLGGLAVAAGGDEEGDVGVGIALANLLEHGRDDDLAGHRAGVVGADDDDLLLALGHDGQGRGADGVGHGGAHELVRGAGGLVFVHMALHDAGEAALGDIEAQEFLTVRELYDRHS